MKRTLLLFLFVAAALPLFSRSSTITMTVDYPGSNVSYSPRKDNAGNSLPPLEVSNQLDVLPRSGGAAATLTIEGGDDSDGTFQNGTLTVSDDTTIEGTLQLTAATLQTAGDDETYSVIVGKGDVPTEGPLGGATFETLTINSVEDTEETQLPITLGTDELVLPGAEALELYPGKVQNPQLPACSSPVKWETVGGKVFLTCN